MIQSTCHTDLEALAKRADLPSRSSLRDCPISQRFVARVPIAFARQHGVVGLANAEGGMELALSDLSAWAQADALRRILGREIRISLAPREEILRAINAAYQQTSGAAQQMIEQISAENVDLQQAAARANEDLLDTASRAPVIKLVNLMLFEAVKRHASDVHVQPYEDRLVVRFRIDGVLHDVFSPPQALQMEILSRIKVMGGMNIAERRLPQDGRATVEVGDRVVDLRIATLPTSYGERAVVRLLDKSVRLYALPELGMPEDAQTVFRRLIRMDHGIILVTGPTGSGKSTTLYAALQEINSTAMNILTLEDPIEYRLDGISQTQISDKKGMTFASGLRNVLRQDPDVIMLGEIRDGETARMAIQSALTGHLVFSTLHTNDAAGAVARMLDLGVEPYLLASSLLGVVAQRLVRRVCPQCQEAFEPTESQLRLWDLEADGKPMYQGTGCEGCFGTGFRGRQGLFEMLTVNDLVRELILKCGTASAIKQMAQTAGMRSLRLDGIDKARSGITTMDEVLRVTARDEV